MQLSVELAAAIRGRLASMHERHDAPLSDGLFDFGVAEHDPACLVGQRESLKRGLGKQPVDLGRKLRRQVWLAP